MVRPTTISRLIFITTATASCTHTAGVAATGVQAEQQQQATPITTAFEASPDTTGLAIQPLKGRADDTPNSNSLTLPTRVTNPLTFTTVSSFPGQPLSPGNPTTNTAITVSRSTSSSSEGKPTPKSGSGGGKASTTGGGGGATASGSASSSPAASDNSGSTQSGSVGGGKKAVALVGALAAVVFWGL